MTILQKKKKVGKKPSDAAVIHNFSAALTCLKPPYMTSPQPSPAEVILSGPKWVNAEQLEALQPFGLL